MEYEGMAKGRNLRSRRARRWRRVGRSAGTLRRRLVLDQLDLGIALLAEESVNEIEPRYVAVATELHDAVTSRADALERFAVRSKLPLAEAIAAAGYTVSKDTIKKWEGIARGRLVWK